MAETLLIIFIAFILLGMPISIALGVGALGAALLFPALNPIIIPTRFVGLLSDSYLLLSAPLFILAGNIAARGGVARVIIDLATALVGRFRGGLAYVNVVDSMFFGGISGSAVADVSALGTFLIPQMVRKGYDLDFATALTISTAVLAPIIPPSIIAVIYAWMAEESVAAMFAAGILPGLLVGLGMAVPVFVIARQRGSRTSVVRPCRVANQPGWNRSRRSRPPGRTSAWRSARTRSLAAGSKYPKLCQRITAASNSPVSRRRSRWSSTVNVPGTVARARAIASASRSTPVIA